MTSTDSYAPSDLANVLVNNHAPLTSLHGRKIGLDVNGGLVIQVEALGVHFNAAPSTSNIAIITLQFLTNEGVPYAGIVDFTLWLSDAATGLGVTGTTASGAVANSGTSGKDLAALVTKKVIMAQSDATGAYTLSITDTAKTGFYVAVGMGRFVTPRVSAQLVAGNFG